MTLTVLSQTVLLRTTPTRTIVFYLIMIIYDSRAHTGHLITIRDIFLERIPPYSLKKTS